MGFYIPKNGKISEDTKKKFFRDLFYLMIFFGLSDENLVAPKRRVIDELRKLKLWHKYSPEVIEKAIRSNMIGFFVVDEYNITMTQEGIEFYRIRE